MPGRGERFGVHISQLIHYFRACGSYWDVTTGVTSGAAVTAYPSEASEFSPGF